MADSSFLNKALGWIKSFLDSMPSPVDGYSIQDAKLNARDGEYSVLYQFASNPVKDETTGEALTDIHGNPLPLNVLISTTNVQEALKPILSGLNNIDDLAYSENEADRKKAVALLAVFLGEGRGEAPVEESFQMLESVEDIFAASDNKSDNAKGGLLGTKLTDVTTFPTEGYSYEGKVWSWAKIAGEYLKYALECQYPGKDFGAIENVALANCGKLIGEYLVKMKVIANADELKINVTNLIKPAMIRLQADLKTYYDAAYEKYVATKNIKDTSKEDREAAEQEEADKQAQAEQLAQEQEDAERMQRMEDMGFQFSKQISVKLQKVQGSIDLLGLQSNYSPSDTLDDIEDIIYQDEFINALPEEPQAFVIDVDDEGYDIEPCENCEIDPCGSLWSVMQNAIVMYRNMYTLHWMSKGNDMMKLHILSEELYGELIQEIDTLGELMVEKCGTVKSLDFEWTPIATKQYDFQEGLSVIKDFIQNYIDTIDYAYPNQTSDVQSTFDEWLRYWNKQLNYFVKGQEA